MDSLELFNGGVEAFIICQTSKTYQDYLRICEIKGITHTGFSSLWDAKIKPATTKNFSWVFIEDGDIFEAVVTIALYKKPVKPYQYRTAVVF